MSEQSWGMPGGGGEGGGGNGGGGEGGGGDGGGGDGGADGGKCRMNSCTCSMYRKSLSLAGTDGVFAKHRQYVPVEV